MTKRFDFLCLPFAVPLFAVTAIFLTGTCAVGFCQETDSVVKKSKDENSAEEKPAIDDAHFSPLDVFELEIVRDTQISPDGRRIAYVRQYFDIMTDQSRAGIWMVEPDDNASGGEANLPLLTGSSMYMSPTWSPDGKRLAYVTNADGSSQIHCYWIDSKRSASLTRLTESPSSMSWSHDGKWIAFLMRVPKKKKPFAKMPSKPEGAKWADSAEVITKLRYRTDGGGYVREGHAQLFIVSAAGGTPRQITSGPFNHGGPISWSPENDRLIFSANRHEDADFQPSNSEIYSVDIAERKVTAMTDRNGPDSGPVLSHDGKTIAYTGYDDQLLGFQASKIYMMDADGSNSREVVGDLDRSIGGLQWSQNPKGVFFQYDDFGKTKIGFTDLEGKVTKDVATDLVGSGIGRPYGGGSFTVSKNGTIAYTSGSTQRPPDLSRTGLGSKPERITEVNEDLFAFKTLGKVEEIRFKSSHDKIDLQGWIIYPPDFDKDKKYPLLLEIHGGPFANYGSRFSAECQLFAAAGNVVLYMNPRGSTSYGAEFANLIHHNYPSNDYDDLMSGVDEVIKKGFIDEERLFVTGGSGGGVLTAWIVGSTDRFRAAVVAKPVINWYSFALTADMYNVFYKYWFPGFPWDHQEEYMKRSPISLVGNVTTPTMLLTGTDDYRTPMSETEQYYQALKLRKVDTALVRIPGAGHGIASRPSRLISKVVHILKWFEMHDKSDKDE